MLQYNQKRNNRHKVVDLRQVLSLPYGSSNKAGLFIFACYSYQYRQAVQSEMNHLKKSRLKTSYVSICTTSPLFQIRGDLPP